MRISFDLDDTLIPDKTQMPIEEALPPLRRGYIEERLRRGARELMTTLHKRGVEIWIYTNSMRGKQNLLAWFAACEIPISNVINEQLHEVELGKRGLLPRACPVKCPHFFGIDLHVDDSKQVEDDGLAHGFQVLRVAPDDPGWVETVLSRVDAMLQG